MVKKLALVLIVVLAAAGALYQFGGMRVRLDGSGLRPRFVTRVPDYDALEADRARQRELASSAARAETPATPKRAMPEPAPATAEAPAAVRAPAPSVEAAGGRRTDWTDFRGPRRDGRYDFPIRTNWPAEGLRPLWKQPIGLGYASFVASGGIAYTIEQRRNQEVVAAYDVESGRELWTDAWDGEFVEAMGGDGPRATPTYHDGRVYALGALGELRCLDARTGARLWRRNILTDNGAGNLDWGMSAAPLVVDDKVIVLPGGRGGRSIVAYHRETGEPVWRSLDDRQAYSSPMLATIGGVRQVLALGAARLVAVDPADGRLLWEYPWATDMGINVAQPLILGDDRVFLSAGYGHGAAVLHVTRSGNGFSAQKVWENTRMKNKFTSSVLHGGHIYGLDEAILACIDAATGEPKWKAGRYGYGQLLLAGDHLVVLTEDGDLVLVRATPERHEEVARSAAIEGKTWNHPIITEGRLLVRNVREMAAFDVRP